MKGIYTLMFFVSFISFAIGQCPTSHTFVNLDSTWVLEFDQSPQNNQVQVDTTDNDTVDYQLTGDLIVPNTNIYGFNIPMSEGVIFYNLRFKTGGPQVECNGYNQALPVELIYFAFERKTNRLKLKWGTATETNNDRFEIQSSIDGKKYSTIATIPGWNNSVTVRHYSYEDFLPVKTTYFRLKQVDTDGAFEYSDVLVYDEKPKTKFVYKAYPEGIYVNERSSLYDLTGRMVRRLEEGLNYFYLPTGVYILQGLSGTAKLNK